MFQVPRDAHIFKEIDSLESGLAVMIFLVIFLVGAAATPVDVPHPHPPNGARARFCIRVRGLPSRVRQRPLDPFNLPLRNRASIERDGDL